VRGLYATTTVMTARTASRAHVHSWLTTNRSGIAALELEFRDLTILPHRILSIKKITFPNPSSRINFNKASVTPLINQSK
jgi:hypothetical protein